jgi:hypothetical protein
MAQCIAALRSTRTAAAALLAVVVSGVPAFAQVGDRPCPPVDQATLRETVFLLQECLSRLEGELAREQQRPDRVDLSERETAPLDETPREGTTPAAPGTGTADRASAAGEQASPDVAVISQPWYRNVVLSGFGAIEYLDSGAAGTRPFGGFAIRESSLFVEAKAWDNVALFLEVQVNRLGKDKDLFVRTGEAHVVWRNLLGRWGDDLLHVKAGRVDIPFGEDYLWQDAIDNPLISFTAAYPYGFDEGVVLFGTLKGVGWVAAVTDGTDDRSIEDNTDKAVNVKLYGRPLPGVYVSASAMRTGQTGESALEFGGSHIEPVGTGLTSTLGKSTSREVSARLAQADATITPTARVTVALSGGTARLNDADDTFDRPISWFWVEPRYRLRADAYVIARYSEIGTYDDTRGYHFDGKTTAGGHGAYGYDVQRLQRLSVGVGYRPNPRMLLKAEVGRDWFTTIRASSLGRTHGDRLLLGAGLVVGF